MGVSSIAFVSQGRPRIPFLAVFVGSGKSGRPRTPDFARFCADYFSIEPGSSTAVSHSPPSLP